MRVASLDLGTNTFLLLVAEASAGRIQSVLHDEARVVRLGQGVHENRAFHPAALRRADECFRDYAATFKRLGAKRVLACATSAARDVKNGDELIRLAARYGIPIEIISGEREAELTFRGTIDEDETDPFAIIDVGGGSTELIFGTGQILRARLSLDVGSVRMTELFVTGHPTPNTDLEKMRDYINAELAKARAKFPDSFQSVEKPGQATKVIAVAGTPTTLATLEQGLPFESERVHGLTLPLERLKEWVERLAQMKISERQALAGMEPKRADVIVAGALILQLAAESLRAKNLSVSVRGLRYGIARALSEMSEEK